MSTTRRAIFRNVSVLVLLSVLGILVLASSTTMFAAASPTPSAIYSGYQVTGPYTTIRVAGSWIVPTANCAATPNSVSNISVIIDGISGENDAMEIGTYQNCVNGVAQYGAFLNVYPVTTYYGNKSSIDKLLINPGDVIEAQGTWRKSAQPINWNTNFVDETTCTQLDTDAYSPTGFTPVQNSGALVLSNDGKTLTSLSTIESGHGYTGTSNCGGDQETSNTDVTGPQLGSSTFGETGALSGYTLVEYQIAGTTVSALTSSGSSFEITQTSSTTSTSTTTSSSTITTTSPSSSTSTSTSTTTTTSTSTPTIDSSCLGTSSSGSSNDCSISTSLSPDLLIAELGTGSSGSVVSSISDTEGLTWTLYAHYTLSSGSKSLFIYYAFASTILTSDTVTAQYTGSGTNGMMVIAVNNYNPSGPFDPSSGPATSSSSTAETSIQVNPVTTANANELLLGMFAIQSSPTVTPGSGFTALSYSSTPTVYAEWEQLPSASSGLSVPATLSTAEVYLGTAFGIVPAPLTTTTTSYSTTTTSS